MCALYGNKRDVSLFNHFNEELINDIIDTIVYYYKLVLEETKTNLYGESTERVYYNPVKIPAHVSIEDEGWQNRDGIQDHDQTGEIAFLRHQLKVDTVGQVYPEVGDIIEWEGDYYEVDGIVQNQKIVNKADHWEGLGDGQTHGDDFSIRCSVHKVRRNIPKLVEYRAPINEVEKDEQRLEDDRLY